jgi:hypothetical protein
MVHVYEEHLALAHLLADDLAGPPLADEAPLAEKDALLTGEELSRSAMPGILYTPDLKARPSNVTFPPAPQIVTTATTIVTTATASLTPSVSIPPCCFVCDEEGCFTTGSMDAMVHCSKCYNIVHFRCLGFTNVWCCHNCAKE